MKPSTVSGAVLCIGCLLISHHAYALPFSVVVLNQQWQATASHEATQPPAPTVSGGYNENLTAPDTVTWFKESRVRALTTNPTTNRTVNAEVRTQRELIAFAGYERFTHRNQITNPGLLVTTDSTLSGTATTFSSITLQITTTVPVTVSGSVGANFYNQFQPVVVNSPNDIRSALFRIYDGSNQLIFEHAATSSGTGSNGVNLLGLVPSLSSGIYRFESTASANWNVTGATGYVGSASGVSFTFSPTPGATGMLMLAGCIAMRRKR